MAVGIFDSGLGGLTVLEACANRLPDQAFIYMGDNLNAPYGVRDTSNIFDVPTSSPIVMRGTLWPTKESSGFLHRSPPIEGSGKTRLLLVLDPISDPKIEPNRTNFSIH